MPKSKSDMSNHPNPLPCGCGAVGTPDMDTLGTKMEYRNIHVRLCPLHAAAPELYQALVGVMQLIADGKLIRRTSDDPDPDWAMRQLPFVLALGAAEAALAKARGDASSTSSEAPPVA